MTERKILGIIGGMGSLAAVDTFDRLVALQDAPTDQDYLEVVLHNNAHVPDRTLALLHGGDSPLPEILRSVALCEGAGCRVLLLACMTSHHHLPQIRAAASAEVLDGVAETVAHIRNTLPDARRVGILATSGSLSCGLYQEPLREAGLDPVHFEGDEQQHHVMDAIYAPWGIKAGHTTGRPQERLQEAVALLRERGAEVVIGGCTEVQVVLGDEAAGLPLVHAVDCLVRAAIVRCGGRLR
jgi:aspartate racemase